MENQGQFWVSVSFVSLAVNSYEPPLSPCVAANSRSRLAEAMLRKGPEEEGSITEDRKGPRRLLIIR